MAGLPHYQDEVKNKKSGYVGIVIAVYVENSAVYFDVRGVDDRIYYRTPANNWETLKTEEERFE